MHWVFIEVKIHGFEDFIMLFLQSKFFSSLKINTVSNEKGIADFIVLESFVM